MPAILIRGPADRSNYGLRLGIVNNMPDAAMSNTLRQFLDVLEGASVGLRVQVFLLAMPQIARGDIGKKHMRENPHFDASQIASMGLDALIVTGTEPKAPHLKDEPYWPALASLFDWIDREGPPTVFSCLAAHAAVLHYDGIERQRLSEKRFGFFPHTITGKDALTANLPPLFTVAHSRCNEVPGEALEAGGYRVLTASAEAGADLFVKQRRNTLMFFQGHPEYDIRALGREYQRDVRRFLTGERDTYPSEPRFYFNPTELEVLNAFRARAEANRGEDLMTEFPPLAERFRAALGTSQIAAAVYGVWLRQIAENAKRRTVWEPALQRAVP